MTATVLRNEIHKFIDTIPDYDLPEIQSYITCFYDNDGSDSVIEVASPEEAAHIQEAVDEYHKDPSCAMPWAELRKQHTPK